MGVNFATKSHKKRRIMSDINITPFVDVLLVLLIIFMITAPMISSNIKVDLPEGATEAANEKEQVIIVSIKSDGSIFLQDEPIKLGDLGKNLGVITNNNFKNKINIRADKTIDYGRVMEVIKNINLAGFMQVALVTEIIS
jgi:biopolymer transport protein TolR